MENPIFCKCGCGEVVERRSYETDRQWEKRSKLGVFRDKCKKNLPAHPRPARPLPTLELVSLCYEVGEGRAQPKDVPERDAKYLAWIRTLPCLVPGCMVESQAHHQNRRKHGGKGTTASDYRALPICIFHHRLGGYSGKMGSYHGEGKISGWGFWKEYGIDVESTIINLNEQYNWLQKYKEKRP